MPNRDTLLLELERQIKFRNADDFLEDIIEHFDGYFGSYLTGRQMERDHDQNCQHCKDELDAGLIGED